MSTPPHMTTTLLVAALALVGCNGNTKDLGPLGSSSGATVPSSTTATASTTEICDGLDNDGDGEIDEDLLLTTWYPDLDGDGFGDDTGAVEACEAPPNHVEIGGDCDDSDLTVHPGDVLDRCDGIDNDCDQTVDEDHRSDWWLGTINGGSLWRVDPATAQTTRVVDLWGPGSDQTINSTDSMEQDLIVVHNLGLGSGTLQLLDSCTGELTTLGNTGTASLPGISFGPDGYLYGVEAGADTIIRIDPLTTAWTNLLSLGFNLNNSGAAYDCTEEIIWFADATNSQVFWVDPLAATTGGHVNTDVPFASVGLEWDQTNSHLYASTGQELWTIDPQTGTGTLVGPLPVLANSYGNLGLFPPCNGQTTP